MAEHEDDERRILEEEEVQEILDWSVGTAAMIILLYHMADHENDEEARDRIDSYSRAVEMMMDNMPESLVDSAHSTAAEAVQDAEEEQELVQQFIEEMKDL